MTEYKIYTKICGPACSGLSWDICDAAGEKKVELSKGSSVGGGVSLYYSTIDDAVQIIMSEIAERSLPEDRFRFVTGYAPGTGPDQYSKEYQELLKKIEKFQEEVGDVSGRPKKMEELDTLMREKAQYQKILAEYFPAAGEEKEKKVLELIGKCAEEKGLKLL